LPFAFPLPALAQAPKPDQSIPGWWLAAEGGGAPPGQSATDYAAEIDHKVAHGGKAAVSLRSIVAKPTGFRTVVQLIKPDNYRGKRIRLAGHLKTSDVVESAGLWLRVDGPSSALGFDNMDRRPVKGTTDWTRHEVVLDVPESALRIAFGPIFIGKGQMWADDLTLEVVDPDKVKSSQLIQYSNHFAERASNLDFEAAGNSIPAWDIHGHGSKSYSYRIAEAGAHGGKAFLEAKSIEGEAPLVFSAAQNIAAAPYAGKRVRFRAFLKTEGVEKEAGLSMEVGGKSAWTRTSTSGRGVKGKMDWQPLEIVIDVPADAEILGLGVELGGAGTFGVDDISVEIVDPAKVAVTSESETIKATRAKRVRELAEADPKRPTQPENLDFER
jgi:hypothetical protein